MTDVFDRAQQLEEFQRETSLGHVRLAAHELASPAVDADCRDCADPIEPERRAALPGATRCLTCQEALERGRRLCRA